MNRSLSLPNSEALARQAVPEVLVRSGRLVSRLFADEAPDVGLHVDLKLRVRLDELAAAIVRHGPGGTVCVLPDGATKAAGGDGSPMLRGHVATGRAARK